MSGKKPAFNPGQVKAKLPSTSPQPKPKAEPAVPTPQKIPGIGKIIAVASGKGGVGKSTVSALLACAFADAGLKTALLDADVYGPSQVQMFGCREAPKTSPIKQGEKPKIFPVKSGNVSLMSFSFFMDVNDPVIWRGPMIMSVVKQFLFDVEWGEQDVMIVDLPPGTGDAPLSLIQCVPVDGALIVTTPQVISVMDAIKGGQMFRKLKVPLFGVVENMSGFVCNGCNKRHDLFRKGGGDIAADKIQTKILGRLPLYPQVCDWMDQGRTANAYEMIRPEITPIADQLRSVLGLTSSDKITPYASNHPKRFGDKLKDLFSRKHP